MKEKPKCFIIMPITTPVPFIETYSNDKNHFTNILNHLFIPAIEKSNFEAISPKSTGSEIIHADIISNLSSCDLVLWDMSIINPNVFFEFGIRCALDKPVSLVIDDKTENVPFDTNIINFHRYKSIPVWEIDNEIEKLSVHIKDSFTKSNNQNALWKYFGIRQKGSFAPENTTLEDKMDFIIDKFSNSEIVFDYQESAFFNLTFSETKVLKNVSQGLTNREIATKLDLSEGTVRNYVSSILGKLGVTNRSEATAFAIKNGLLNSDND